MRTNDAESDLDRELARLKLRDIVIGSAVAAVLLAMMPGHVQRGTASVPKGRAHIAVPLLPKPKPRCDRKRIEDCPAQAHALRHATIDYGRPETAQHIVDIRV